MQQNTRLASQRPGSARSPRRRTRGHRPHRNHTDVHSRVHSGQTGRTHRAVHPRRGGVHDWGHRGPRSLRAGPRPAAALDRGALVYQVPRDSTLGRSRGRQGPGSGEQTPLGAVRVRGNTYFCSGCLCPVLVSAEQRKDRGTPETRAECVRAGQSQKIRKGETVLESGRPFQRRKAGSGTRVRAQRKGGNVRGAARTSHLPQGLAVHVGDAPGATGLTFRGAARVRRLWLPFHKEQLSWAGASAFASVQ